MTKTTVAGPTAGDRGSWDWQIQWHLDRPSVKGGWIVEVTVSGKIKGSDGKATPTGWEGYGTNGKYWEAWKVNAGQSITTYNENNEPPPFDDQYANGSYPAGSKGTVTEAGVAVFYEDLTLPASFAARNVAPAGDLPSTASKPDFWHWGLNHWIDSSATNRLTHTLQAKWDSSKGDDSTKITTK